jgi:hypothetical protein
MFGGVRDGDRRFCNKTCRDNAYLTAASSELPAGFIIERALEIHSGPCPKCGGEGPVDVHTSYYVWSIFILTRMSETSEVCCKSCGTKAKLKATAQNLLCGWWGIPWGLVFTPAQIIRNLGYLASSPDPHQPSDELIETIRTRLSAQLVHEDRTRSATQPARE